MILGLLEEKEGVYHLPISSSPEIHDDTIRAFVMPDSNYDLALMRYLSLSLSKLFCGDVPCILYSRSIIFANLSV